MGVLVGAVVALTLLCAVLVNGQRKQTTRINDNRVQQTRQGCEERNEERAILRTYFADQVKQTKALPESAFKLFEVEKDTALNRLEGYVTSLSPLNCGAKVQAVRDAID